MTVPVNSRQAKEEFHAKPQSRKEGKNKDCLRVLFPLFSPLGLPLALKELLPYLLVVQRHIRNRQGGTSRIKVDPMTKEASAPKSHPNCANSQ